MSTISITPVTWSYLRHIEGETTDEKLLALLSAYLSSQVRQCEEEIAEYELKYQMTFDQFAAAWESGLIADPHSHEVERDYMEWEGLEAEKGKWLALLRALLHPDGEQTAAPSV
jgi:hypothetical protein